MCHDLAADMLSCSVALRLMTVTRWCRAVHAARLIYSNWVIVPQVSFFFFFLWCEFHTIRCDNEVGAARRTHMTPRHSVRDTLGNGRFRKVTPISPGRHTISATQPRKLYLFDRVGLSTSLLFSTCLEFHCMMILKRISFSILSLTCYLPV